MPKAMSMTIGGSRSPGTATANGFMPTILSIPPHGAMVGRAFVPAMPIMSCGKACIAQ